MEVGSVDPDMSHDDAGRGGGGGGRHWSDGAKRSRSLAIPVRISQGLRTTLGGSYTWVTSYPSTCQTEALLGSSTPTSSLASYDTTAQASSAPESNMRVVDACALLDQFRKFLKDSEEKGWISVIAKQLGTQFVCIACGRAFGNSRILAYHFHVAHRLTRQERVTIMHHFVNKKTMFVDPMTGRIAKNNNVPLGVGMGINTNGVAHRAGQRQQISFTRRNINRSATAPYPSPRKATETDSNFHIHKFQECKNDVETTAKTSSSAAGSTRILIQNNRVLGVEAIQSQPMMMTMKQEIMSPPHTVMPIFHYNDETRNQEPPWVCLGLEDNNFVFGQTDDSQVSSTYSSSSGETPGCTSPSMPTEDLMAPLTQSLNNVYVTSEPTDQSTTFNSNDMGYHSSQPSSSSSSSPVEVKVEYTGTVNKIDPDEYDEYESTTMPWECPNCVEIYSTQDGLVDHLLTHGEDHSCNYCPGQFDELEQVVSHMNRAHNRQSEQ